MVKQPRRYTYVFKKLCLEVPSVDIMDETVTSRLKQKDLLLFDKLIEMGLFWNRSEAVRNIVSERINELIDEQLISPLQKEMNQNS